VCFLSSLIVLSINIYIYIHTYIIFIHMYIYIQSDLVVPNDSDVAKCADHSGYAATPSPNANVGVVHFS
jgi:hypothetical protein